MKEVLLILLLSALALSLPGVMLVLRNMAMTADALSHTILLGIVLAYFATHELNSPLLLPAAALFGLFTVLVINKLTEKGKLTEDAATGLVFPLFFSLAVLLISRYGQGAHLDLDNVIMGDVVFAPFNQIEIFGLRLPKAVFTMGLTLFLNLLFIIIFYKEIKLFCFDPEMAKLNKLWPEVLTQLFIFLLSFSAVTAFDVLGAVLVIAFLVIPAATALLVSRRFLQALFLTGLLALIYTAGGLALALRFNVSIAGMCAAVMGAGFFIVFFFRREGFAAGRIRRRRVAKRLRREAFLLHVYNHEGRAEASYELGLETLPMHLNWPERKVRRLAEQLIAQGLLRVDRGKQVYALTESGAEKCREIVRDSFL